MSAKGAAYVKCRARVVFECRCVRVVLVFILFVGTTVSLRIHFSVHFSTNVALAKLHRVEHESWIRARYRQTNNTQRTPKMRLSFTIVAAAVAAPVLAQSTTPAPSATTTDDFVGPPWASSDPAKWSSVYNSLVSVGRIPSTLTAAPWPTGSYGPGQGPWGPGGHGGPGGPGGRHWGGTYLALSFPHCFLPKKKHANSTTNISAFNAFLTINSQAPPALALGAPPTGDPGATGRQSPTGAAVHGPRGGTAAHARRPTGPAGRLGRGAPPRRGRHGAGALRQRRRRVWLRRRLAGVQLLQPRMDCRLRLRRHRAQVQ